MILGDLKSAMSFIEGEGGFVIHSAEPFDSCSFKAVKEGVDLDIRDEYGNSFHLALGDTDSGVVILRLDKGAFYNFDREAFYYCLYHRAASDLSESM